MAKRPTLRRVIQVTLGAAILIVLCITGYRRGYRNGYAVDPNLQVAQFELYYVVYPVGDLITPLDEPDSAELRQQGFDRLIDLIVSTIEHDSWAEHGTGEGKIQPFGAQQSLVIAQTRRVHEQISDLLKQLRNRDFKIDVQEMIPLMQGLAAYQNANSFPIRTAPAGPKNAAVIDGLFNSAVENLANCWGKPEYRGLQADADFPKWSQARQLAMWPRGDGYAFIAVQDEAPSGRSLRVGWRLGD
jgi:hypothetical protein